MLRPERMSKVSLSGAKTVMAETIEVLHEQSLLHLEEYDESWEDFQTGDPLPMAEDLSERLVTVRSLENTLEIDPEAVEPTQLPDEAEIDRRLEEIRQQVTELEDRRAALNEELRAIEDDLNRLEPLATLGIDLELLQDYASIEVVVGQGPESGVRTALEESDEVAAFELFVAEDVIAIAAEPASPEASVSDALVGVEFNRLEVPDGQGDPSERADALRQERRELEAELEQLESNFEEITDEHADFLLALEEELSIGVERAEAPLRFATTEHSFIAEGWVPTAEVETLRSALAAKVGDRVALDELEQVDYDPPEHDHEAAADGGQPDLHRPEPPVEQDNPSFLQPFEVFVQTVNRPHYHELDPTLFVFLTFPLAFGFMIGDMGYGLLYLLLGLGVLKFVNSDGLRSIGVVGMWAGGFTMLFGYLYDEAFGVHLADLGLHLPAAGTLAKGLQMVDVAQLWIIASILFGVLHLSIGYVMGFLNDREHGLYHAFTENASWLLVLWGLFAWLFTTEEVGTFEGIGAVANLDLTASGIKPAFLVGPDSVLNANYMFELGFTGFSETVAVAALVSMLVGIVFVYQGEGGVGLIELPTNAFGHAVSYIRMMAVLLAKAGMAFVVNLIVFGGVEETHHNYAGEEIPYTVFKLPGTEAHGEAVFEGLIWLDPIFITIPIAILLFILGHVVVMLLGITAAGIQMTRLEYVEFFGKFYEGGGEKFQPFGYKRSYTQEN